MLVKRMANKGQEIILGINRDEAFGPMLMVGMGGVYVEVMKDVAFAPAPLTEDDAHALLEQLKPGATRRHAGEPAADVSALVDLMFNLGCFAADFADTIQEFDLNPVLVHPQARRVRRRRVDRQTRRLIERVASLFEDCKRRAVNPAPSPPACPVFSTKPSSTTAPRRFPQQPAPIDPPVRPTAESPDARHQKLARQRINAFS